MQKPPDKKETLLAYLERGIAMLHLDARRPGVLVPAQHVGDPHLRLNLSYRFAINDLTIGEHQIVATLSFRGEPFRCVLPWTAVFGLTSAPTGDGQVWPEDLPVEVVEQLREETEAAPGPEAGKKTKRVARKRKAEPARSPLRAVEPADEPPAAGTAKERAIPPQTLAKERPAPPEAPAAEQKAPVARGHLRLVK